MFRNFKYVYYYLHNPKLRYQFFLICKRKFLKFLLFNKNNNQNLDSYELSNVNQVCDYLKIDNFIDPKIKYKEIFDQRINVVQNNPYSFGGAADLSMLYNISNLNTVENILETGVANGWSSLSIMLAINPSKSKKLTSIDLPYPYKNSQTYIGGAVPKDLKKNWNLIIDDDKKILLNLYKENTKFDFVHYDSDKSYDGRIKSYNLIWNILNTGGILMSDDIFDNNAFIYFANSKNVKPLIYEFEGKHVGIIKK